MTKVGMWSLFCHWMFFLASETQEAALFEWAHSLLTHMQSWQDPRGHLHSAVLLARCASGSCLCSQKILKRRNPKSQWRETGKVFVILHAALCSIWLQSRLTPHRWGTCSAYLFAQVNLGELHTSAVPEHPEITWNHTARTGRGDPTEHKCSETVFLAHTTLQTLGLPN